MRFYLGLMLLALTLPVHAANQPRLVLMPPEIDGDLSGTSGASAWTDRLALLERTVRDGLIADALYMPVDLAPAADYFEQLSHRAAIYECTPCATGAAKRLNADRVLNLRVFRVSALILTLHAYLRDAATGDIRYVRALDFRGDNDKAWLRVAAYLIRDMGKIPADQR